MGMFQISCLAKSGFWSGRGVRQVCFRFLMSDMFQLTDCFPYIFYNTSIYITFRFYWCKWFFAYNINKYSRYYLIFGEKATEVNCETKNTNSGKQEQKTRFNTVPDIIMVTTWISTLFLFQDSLSEILIPAARLDRTLPVPCSCFFFLPSIVELFQCSIVPMFFHFLLPCSLFEILTSQGENTDFHPDRVPQKEKL